LQGLGSERHERKSRSEGCRVWDCEQIVYVGRIDMSWTYGLRVAVVEEGSDSSKVGCSM